MSGGYEHETLRQSKLIIYNTCHSLWLSQHGGVATRLIIVTATEDTQPVRRYCGKLYPPLLPSLHMPITEVSVPTLLGYSLILIF